MIAAEGMYQVFSSVNVLKILYSIASAALRKKVATLVDSICLTISVLRFVSVANATILSGSPHC